MKRIIRRSFLLLMVLMFCTSFVFAAGNKEASKKKIDPALDKWLKEAQLGDYAPKQENWAETVKKATAEGKVVIYSSSSRIHKVKDLFEKTYPGIKLEAYNIESLKLVEKFGREYKSGIYNVDVIFGGEGVTLYKYWQEGMLWKYVPPRVKDLIPANFQKWLLIHRWGPGSVIYYNPVYWKTLPPIHNLWDFTDPKWKGKIVMADPLQHGGTLSNIVKIVYDPNAEALAAAYKKKYGKDIDITGYKNAGYYYIAKLVKNGLIIVKSDDNVVDSVGAPNQSGMPPFGLFVTMSKMRKRKEKGLNLAVLAPGIVEPFETFGSPPTATLNGAPAGIAAHAPHPYAARVLIDFLEGDKNGDGGNKPWHVIGNWSTRNDVKSAPGDIQDRNKLNTLKAVPDPEWVEKNTPLVRDFWMSLVF